MVDKNSDERVEEVLFDVVEETCRIVQELAVGDHRIGTRRRSVGFIEACALGPDSTVLCVRVVAHPSASTIERAEQVWTGLAEKWTS